MSQIEDEFMKEKGIIPFISFKDGTPHKVKILKREKNEIKDKQGNLIKGISYYVEENSEPKSFFTCSLSLIQQLARVNDGQTVEITMKKKLVDGKYKSYFETQKIDSAGKEEDEEQIPIIEEEEVNIDEIPF